MTALLEPALYRFLSAAVGHDRVYPDALPQDPTLPAEVYHRISTVRAITLDEAAGPSMARSRFQVDCLAEDDGTTPAYDLACAEADAIMAAAHGYRGQMGVVSGPDPDPGVRVGSCFVEGDRDEPDPERGYARRMVDLMIWNEEG